MRRGEARAVLASLVAAFPNAQLERASEELFVTQIEDFESTEAAIGAVKVLIRECRFFPSLAEIHEAYRGENRRIVADRVSLERMQELEEGEPSEEEKERVQKELDRVRDSFGRMNREESETSRVQRRVQELKLADPGRCDDCLLEDSKAPRVVLGKVTVCKGCAELRLQAAERTAA